MSEINVKEEMLKLVNALSALCPSNNYISQYIQMLPMDYPSTYDMFPEFLSTLELRKLLEEILGITYGANVDLGYAGRVFAQNLKNFLEQILSFLEDTNIRQKLTALTGASDDAIPNPRKDWIEVRLKGVSLIPNLGPHAIKIIALILESLEPMEGWRSFSELVKLIKLEEKQTREIINLLVSKYRLLVADNRSGKEGYRLADDLNRYREVILQMKV